MFRDPERPDPLDTPVRVSLSISRSDLTELDREVFRQSQDHRQRRGPNRDAIIREAVREYLQRQAERRLAGTGRRP